MARRPVRTCIACRSPRPQAEFVRLTSLRDGGQGVRTVAPWTRRSIGRSAYVCRQPTCLESARRVPALARAFRSAVALPGASQWARMTSPPERPGEFDRMSEFERTSEHAGTMPERVASERSQ